MKPVVLLGSAPCLERDLQELRNIVGRNIADVFDFIAVGMDTMNRFPGKIVAFFTLHTKDICPAKEKRKAVGGNMDFKTISHIQCDDLVDIIIPYSPPSGSSALHAVFSAMQMGYRKIILAGCPLEGDRYQKFHQGWEWYQNYVDDVRSMSGWTASFLGKPTKSWLGIEGITAITLTGGRPYAFALCRRWVEQQTVSPDQWIVVNDGKEHVSVPSWAEEIYRQPREDDPPITMMMNMAIALMYVRNSIVLVMEDDEYYSPRYIEVMSEHLKSHELVGIGWSRYYHLPTGGYKKDTNGSHASLAQTGWRSQITDVVRECIGDTPWLDIEIWKRSNGNKLMFDDEDDKLYVGMKGLPGREGIGIGHRGRAYTQYDKDRSILKSWIREDDVIHYLKLIGEN